MPVIFALREALSLGPCRSVTVKCSSTQYWDEDTNLRHLSRIQYKVGLQAFFSRVHLDVKDGALITCKFLPAMSYKKLFQSTIRVSESEARCLTSFILVRRMARQTPQTARPVN